MQLRYIANILFFCSQLTEVNSRSIRLRKKASDSFFEDEEQFWFRELQTSFTNAPTVDFLSSPNFQPLSEEPSAVPTTSPSALPLSAEPSFEPSAEPTLEITSEPSMEPSAQPSV